MNSTLIDRSQTHVLIISSDPLSALLAGVGMRSVEMARHLASYCNVTLLAPEIAAVTLNDVECASFDKKQPSVLRAAAEKADVIITQGYTLFHYPFLKQIRAILIVDLYDPFHLETLEIERNNDQDQAIEQAMMNVFILNDQLIAGDFFLCASERQRDFWLGALGAVNRLSPEQYRHDQTFRSLIDVVSFGAVPEPPIHTQNVLKGVVPGINRDDVVLLWGGGIWDWLDPLTIIRAMALIRDTHPAIKLFFMGKNHPNSSVVTQMPMYNQAVELAHELNVYQQTVFFNDNWVPYAERANYLLESDIGVSAQFDHVETRFAFRTRLLDYIWAGLPMIVSAGDSLADVIRELDLGIVVPVGDEQAYAQAMMHLADMDARRQRYAQAFEKAQKIFAWNQTLQPLIAFCQHPHASFDQHRAKVSEQVADRVPDYGKMYHYTQHLEAAVKQKNDHIEYLENLVNKLENGRLLRAVNTLQKYAKKIRRS